ncbi:MAG TPA: thioredoxin domain-containing protein [Allosphingosinicella sp.]|jgi:protein-disulfide isomerase
MRGRIFAALAAASALVLPVAHATAQRAPARPAAQDWTRTVVRTPEGGFRMGNPAAPIKLVEYLSFACPHCAEFHAEGGDSLFQNYVRPGRVSVEYRNILINAADVPATILARCATPRAFFAMGHELLGTQGAWEGRVGSLTTAQRAQLGGQPPQVIAQRLAPMIGLDRIAARYGLTPAAQRACLANRANFNALDRMGNAANSQYGVTGTPTFVINGRTITDTNVWSGIEPLLRGR